MKPLISVIIPVYNAENFLESCIDSIIRQTYENLEILVVNDGSVDGSAALMESLAKKDGRIRCFHKQNTGVSDTRNVGLRQSKGEFIGFVDADDEIYPSMYEQLYKNIVKYDADIAHCSFEIVMAQSRKIFGNTGKVTVQSREESMQSLLKGDLFEPSSCTKLFKRNVLQNVFFEKTVKFNEDLLFNIEAFSNAKKVVFHDVVLYQYTYNIKSASKSAETYSIQTGVIAAAGFIRDRMLGKGIDAAINSFYCGKLVTVLKSLQSLEMRNSELGEHIIKELKKISDGSLSLRLFLMKYVLLFAPGIFGILQKIYDYTAGRKKKWDLK